VTPHIIARWIVACSACWSLWTLALYPLWLALRARLRPYPTRADAALVPAVTAVIPVRNGARFLAAKLDSVLNADYPPDRLAIYVLSDASEDATDTIALDYAARYPGRVRFRRLPRGGKAAALNAAVPELDSELLLLTDVRQPIEAGCVRRLAAHFADARVGVVSGNLKIHSGTSSGEAYVGLYWRYESWIRANLGATGSLLGATGPIYMLRRALFRPLPAGCLLDDMWLPMQAVLRGYRSVWERDAVAWDYPTTLDTEFARKVRTQAGLFQLLWQLPGVLAPGRTLVPFVSLKLGRLLLPEVLLTTLAASVFLRGPLAGLLWIGQALFYALAALDFVLAESHPLKRFTAPVRAFVVLLSAALCALAIFFVPPERLWKHTRVTLAHEERSGT
jgi:cellulose synthase/poly-beta-1,6-N-acetylglucosamine synthase-like glycosyltransferase